jgi:predicted small lipoprotein YifL
MGLNTPGIVNLGLILLAVAGCTHLGPLTIPQDRADYSAAVGDSWQEQQLLNVVKLRYADAPIFLDVGQIVSGYGIDASMSTGMTYAPSQAPDRYRFGANWGAGGGYGDHPTITYTPLTGATFIRSLMTPISPAALLHAIEGGWPADIIFRTCVMSINGVSNRKISGSVQRAGDKRFYRLVELLRTIQTEDAVRMQVEVDKDRQEQTVMIFRGEHISPEAAAASTEMRSLLKLSPDQRVFKVYYGEDPIAPGDVAMLTRSVMQIMMMLSSYIEVPEEHIGSGRTLAPPAEEGVNPLIRIHTGRLRPAGSFVAVPYRGCWYWIDDCDFSSKRVFSFMMLLYSLAETGEKPSSPVVTIPAR